VSAKITKQSIKKSQNRVQKKSKKEVQDGSKINQRRRIRNHQRIRTKIIKVTEVIYMKNHEEIKTEASKLGISKRVTKQLRDTQLVF